MKCLKIVLLILLANVTFAASNAPLQLIGAWQSNFTNKDGKHVTEEVTFVEGYFSMAAYNEASKEFFYTRVGQWSLKANKVIMDWEFDTKDKTQVGKKVAFPITLKNNKLAFDRHNWHRIDDGTPGALAGAWLITGRKRDGEITRRTPGARKTMKVLSGTRFQWIAYNSAIGEFFGTGGGTYTTQGGTYVENIEFFSRDGSRIGASIEFEYKLVEGEWHHSGLSSKGKPIYELWSLRSRL